MLLLTLKLTNEGKTMDEQQHDEQENGLDPDWWIDEHTTRDEYNDRTRRHAAKWRDDWA